MPKKLPEPKKGKGTKRVRADETEDPQATLKNESGSDALRREAQGRVRENEVKHLELLKDFLIHAELYRTITTQTLAQLRPLLKANPFLRPVYDQLRTRSNSLVEEQAALRGSLEGIMEEEN